MNRAKIKAQVHYNQYTGDFTRIQAPRQGAVKLGIISGANFDDGDIKILGEWCRVGRIAWIYMTGKEPKGYVLHKDGDTKNWKWDNLIEGTTATAVHAGIGSCSWVEKKNRWQCYVPIDRTPVYVGLFKTREEGVEANKKKLESAGVIRASN